MKDDKVDYLFQSGAKAYWPHLDLVASLHSAYAKRHGMKYVCYRGPFPASPWVAPKALQTTFDTVWKQWLLMLELIRDQNTGWLFWVDGDAIIVGDKDPRPVMEDCLVGMAWYPENKNHIAHYHRGVMLLRACEQVAELLEHVLEEGPGKHKYYDQGILNRHLTKPQWRGKIKTLPHEWNSCVKINGPEECVIRAWHGMGPIKSRFPRMQAEMRRRRL